jgi:hypothetical protein
MLFLIIKPGKIFLADYAEKHAEKRRKIHNSEKTKIPLMGVLIS